MFSHLKKGDAIGICEPYGRTGLEQYNIYTVSNAYPDLIQVGMRWFFKTTGNAKGECTGACLMSLDEMFYAIKEASDKTIHLIKSRRRLNILLADVMACRPSADDIKQIEQFLEQYKKEI